MGNLQVQVITNERDFDLLEDDWKALYARAPGATTPLKYEWMREWWRIFGARYGKAPGGLTIIVIRDNAVPVAIAPLYVRAGSFWQRPSLRFLSTGEDRGDVVYPEYLTVLTDGSPAAVHRHLFEAVQDLQLRFDEIDFGILSPESPLADLSVADLAAPQDHGIVCSEVHHSYRADISNGLQGYLQLLSRPSTRQQARRILKQILQPGVSFSVAASPAEAQAYLDELVSIHQQRWNAAGTGGAFSSERILAFHSALIAKLAPKKEVVLCKLSVDGEAAALLYGFVTRTSFDFFQCGINYNLKKIKSPGILCHLLCMDFLHKRNIATYDFLPGKSEYKERLATSHFACKRVRWFRPTIRMRATVALRSALRSMSAFPQPVIRLIQARMKTGIPFRS